MMRRLMLAPKTSARCLQELTPKREPKCPSVSPVARREATWNIGHDSVQVDMWVWRKAKVSALAGLGALLIDEAEMTSCVSATLASADCGFQSHPYLSLTMDTVIRGHLMRCLSSLYLVVISNLTLITFALRYLLILLQDYWISEVKSQGKNWINILYDCFVTNL